MKVQDWSPPAVESPSPNHHIVNCEKCGSSSVFLCLSLDSQVFLNCWRCYIPLKLTIENGIGRTETYAPRESNKKFKIRKQ